MFKPKSPHLPATYLPPFHMPRQTYEPLKKPKRKTNKLRRKNKRAPIPDRDVQFLILLCFFFCFWTNIYIFYFLILLHVKPNHYQQRSNYHPLIFGCAEFLEELNFSWESHSLSTESHFNDFCAINRDPANTRSYKNPATRTHRVCACVS